MQVKTETTRNAEKGVVRSQILILKRGGIVTKGETLRGEQSEEEGLGQHLAGPTALR